MGVSSNPRFVSHTSPPGFRAAHTFFRGAIFICLSAVVGISAFAQEKSGDLASQSLEDLMSMQITSVSKQEQKLSQTASAVFVITAEDIRRSNATNIPDVLRMVPGIYVAQINANTWAITARGFNGRFANQLLVLLDGRSVYTPTTDGVFWDVLDVPLEDIERIEVIRGPGASVWATNAVNGVINIITKKASETQGGFVVAGGGTVDQGFGTIRYGATVAKNAAFRIFAKYLNSDHFPSPSGQDGGDGWGLSRIGFRTDITASPDDTLAFEGDLYRGREGNPGLGISSITAPAVPVVEKFVNLGGGFLQGVWNHTYSPEAGITLQLSYDEYERNDDLGETRGTSDVAFQHHFGWGDRQKLIWGVEYRFSQSRTVGSAEASLNPPNLNTSLFSSFIQDEITVVPSRLFVTVGTKFEHNYYTGFDTEPNIRAAWTPDTRQTFWAAVSKADRSPAAIDDSLIANLGGFTEANGTPVAVQLLGSLKSVNEQTISYEAGYRAGVTERLSLRVAAYYDGDDHQQTIEPGPPFAQQAPSPPHLVLPLLYSNLMHGENHGFEIAADWKLNDRWMLSPSYSLEQIHMHLDPTSGDTASVSAAQGSTPVHSAQLRSHLLFVRGFSWDTSAYFSDRLTDPVIPSYTRVDTGLTWQWNRKSSLRIVGQNLTRDHHQEFVDYTGSAATTLIKRSVYAQWTWRF